MKAFADMGITGTDSQTNFVFMDIKRPAAGFRDACRAAGRAGRPRLPAVREDSYCRVSIGTMDEMQQAVAVFKTVLGGTTSTSSQERR